MGFVICRLGCAFEGVHEALDGAQVSCFMRLPFSRLWTISSGWTTGATVGLLLASSSYSGSCPRRATTVHNSYTASIRVAAPLRRFRRSVCSTVCNFYAEGPVQTEQFSYPRPKGNLAVDWRTGARHARALAIISCLGSARKPWLICSGLLPSRRCHAVHALESGDCVSYCAVRVLPYAFSNSWMYSTGAQDWFWGACGACTCLGSVISGRACIGECCMCVCVCVFACVCVCVGGCVCVCPLRHAVLPGLCRCRLIKWVLRWKPLLVLVQSGAF